MLVATSTSPVLGIKSSLYFTKALLNSLHDDFFRVIKFVCLLILNNYEFFFKKSTKITVKQSFNKSCAQMDGRTDELDTMRLCS